MQTLNQTINRELKRAKDRMRSFNKAKTFTSIDHERMHEIRRAEVARQIESLERIKQRAEGTL